MFCSYGKTERGKEFCIIGLTRKNVEEIASACQRGKFGKVDARSSPANVEILIAIMDTDADIQALIAKKFDTKYQITITQKG